MKWNTTKKKGINHSNKKNKTYTNKDFRNGKLLKRDYDSNNGFLTTVWGPCIWTFLHTVSFNYPVNPTKKDKNDYRELIMNLKNILPCGKCRKNLTQNLKIMPLTMKNMESRETFSKYVFELHEVVNRMLNKQSGLTYEVVRDRFENFRAHCLKKQKNEKGCITPLHGVKSKCLINIVPQDVKSDTLSIDKKCLLQKK
jgi:hypothetical protein